MAGGRSENLPVTLDRHLGRHGNDDDIISTHLSNLTTQACRIT